MYLIRLMDGYLWHKKCKFNIHRHFTPQKSLSRLVWLPHWLESLLDLHSTTGLWLSTSANWSKTCKLLCLEDLQKWAAEQLVCCIMRTQLCAVIYCGCFCCCGWAVFSLSQYSVSCLQHHYSRVLWKHCYRYYEEYTLYMDVKCSRHTGTIYQWWMTSTVSQHNWALCRHVCVRHWQALLTKFKWFLLLRP